ncbi:EAL and modified HD-GYP domain-containing signal transduction protein [Thiohalospira halophila DSM 15071]|uniref:EAL and modified HD-GYP domain-containing signal transduction protein n=1 Tax=Thiohalospira halophila DSM 15071 TaxID=1123397 RepID=A0A1I1NX74_9GAMM|nr:HDOD domain-containing protein [Thiohalospira halophila]SFD02016.1 EAL and modified HD-GYP domain-containing signal transduction protein [Thiohalospira halophila DSM 15071]
MQDFFIARQAIYDPHQEVRGYELLARSNAQENANTLPGERATASVLVNAFTEIGLDGLVGEQPAWINLTRDFIGNDLLAGLPRRRIVLELLENIEVDRPLLNQVRRLKAAGSRIALDDFFYRPELEPLIELADVVKVDIRPLEWETVRDHAERLQDAGVTLLAEKVETPEEFSACKEMGFHLYQGFFFCRPKLIQGRRMPANRSVVLQLLAQLEEPETSVNDLERTIRNDVALSYRLLRYLNSAAFMLRQRIETVRRAIVMLGLDRIRHWARILALSHVDDKPSELLRIALIRARMCELKAQHEGLGEEADTYFTIGLFSTLDALLDMTLEDIVASLPLSERVGNALLHHQGDLGRTLACVIHYERAEWECVTEGCQWQPRIKDDYLDAITWADQLSAQLLD